MTTWRNILLVSLCGLMMSGCGGGEEQEPAAPTGPVPPGVGMSPSLVPGERRGEAEEEAEKEPVDAEARAEAQLKSFLQGYRSRLTAEGSKIANLKAGAAWLEEDQQLSKWTAELDEIIQEAWAKLDEIAAIDGEPSGTHKRDMKRLTERAEKLYERAMKRLKDLEEEAMRTVPASPAEK